MHARTHARRWVGARTHTHVRARARARSHARTHTATFLDPAFGPLLEDAAQPLMESTDAGTVENSDEVSPSALPVPDDAQIDDEENCHEAPDPYCPHARAHMHAHTHLCMHARMHAFMNPCTRVWVRLCRIRRP